MINGSSIHTVIVGSQLFNCGVRAKVTTATTSPVGDECSLDWVDPTYFWPLTNIQENKSGRHVLL